MAALTMAILTCVNCKVLGYDHARWVCPGSVGYTCADPDDNMYRLLAAHVTCLSPHPRCADPDDNIGAALLFGAEPEQAP